MSGSDPTNDDPTHRLASLLVDARRSGQPITDVPDDLVPPDLVAADAVDDAVAEQLGQPVGWKIGCTSVAAQQALGSDGPFAGRVYQQDDDSGDGVALAADDLMVDPWLEGEFAFVLGTALPASADGYDRAAVVAAIATVHPAIELVGGRYEQFFGLPLSAIVADAGGNSRLVLGPAQPGVDLATLPAMTATMTVNGETAGEGTGASVMDDPVDALVWLANHLSGRGIGLEAGAVVTTGTATGLAPFPAGATAVAEFGGLGRVELRRAAS